MQGLFRRLDDTLRTWDDMLAMRRDGRIGSPVKKRKAGSKAVGETDDGGVGEAVELYKRIREERWVAVVSLSVLSSLRGALM